jgi:UDP-N-acetylmuramoyl-tripeptide--D-alanyl-D-alanine ligase
VEKREACVGVETADVVGGLEAGASGEGDETKTLHVRWPGGECRFAVPPMPRHTLENLVAAAAGCFAARLPVEECLPGFFDCSLGQRRGELIELPGLCLIDDTYNANPAAVRAAVDNLIRVAGKLGGRPVAILGDMRELGSDELLFHKEIGEYAAKAGVRLLWGVGELSWSTTEGFREVCAQGWGEAEGKAGHVISPAETALVVGSLCPGDVVLFKASRSVKLELMVERIKEEAQRGRWAEEAGKVGGGVTPRRPEPTE